MGDTPKWMKRLVRARMKETGEKYTTALRAIQIERVKEAHAMTREQAQDILGQPIDENLWKWITTHNRQREILDSPRYERGG